MAGDNYKKTTGGMTTQIQLRQRPVALAVAPKLILLLERILIFPPAFPFVVDVDVEAFATVLVVDVVSKGSPNSSKTEASECSCRYKRKPVTRNDSGGCLSLLLLFVVDDSIGMSCNVLLLLLLTFNFLVWRCCCCYSGTAPTVRIL
jgi:hypothetical protein